MYTWSSITIYISINPPISVYNTCTLLLNKEKYVDANLDATDNAISDNESSSEMFTSQSQIPEWAKNR